MAKFKRYRSFRTLSRALEVAARDSWTFSGKPIVVEYDTVLHTYEVWPKAVRDSVPSLPHMKLITTVQSEDLKMDVYNETLAKVRLPA